ncbi:hypothetical protein H9P43_009762 [Blastocladiella emersonii ATCC 22665]|nr:hypothetical protein H9P43_009762 [Blastocladiella emersonii ATCC 22665]
MSSQRESNTYVAGTRLNPISVSVSVGPNHYLSRQIVLYLAHVPSVVDLYNAIADGDEIVTLPGNATPPTGPGSSAATLGGGSGADSAASSEVGPTPHASASAGIHHHRPQRTNTAASTSSGFGFWNPAGGSSSHKAQRSQRLDPWRDISNVLFRLEVDLYALELEDHRLISWHIRAAIDRMERCYRDLVTPLSLDLVARVRGHWRTTATLVLAWLTYAGQPDPSAVPAAAAAGAANASSDNPEDSDDESPGGNGAPAGPAPRIPATTLQERAEAHFYIAFHTLVSGFILLMENPNSVYLKSIPSRTNHPGTYTAVSSFLLILRPLYVLALCITFIASLGNRPQSARHVFHMVIVLFAIVAITMLAIIVLSTMAQFEIEKPELAQLRGLNSLNAFARLDENKVALTLFSLVATYGVYLVSSLLYLEWYHPIFNLIQYSLLTPTYVNVLQIYAFCNISGA